MSLAKLLLIILPFSLIGVIISICSIFRDHHWQGAPESRNLSPISPGFLLFHSFSVTTRCHIRVRWLLNVKARIGTEEWRTKGCPWRGWSQDFCVICRFNPTLLDFYHGNLRVTPATSMPPCTSRKIRPLSGVMEGQWQWWDLNFALCSVVICFFCRSIINLWTFPLQTIPAGCI